MITEAKAISAVTYGKSWCEDCAKTLTIEEAENNGMDELTQSAISYLLFVSERHEHLHPEHNIIITIYERRKEQGNFD